MEMLISVFVYNSTSQAQTRQPRTRTAAGGVENLQSESPNRRLANPEPRTAASGRENLQSESVSVGAVLLLSSPHGKAGSAEKFHARKSFAG